ncbi:MAG: hypothetical protein RJQ09_20330 [Cyclobacteriaceae bacterium]
MIQTILKQDYTNEEGDFVSHTISTSVQLTGFGLLIVLALIIMNQPLWKYAFTVLAMLALTQWFNFYNYTFSFGIGFIQFELTALTLLTIHIMLNKEVFNSFKAFFKSVPEAKELKNEKFEASVEGFKVRFQGKSTQELNSILTERTLVPEAIEAARRLLKDNSKTN